jgi:hypothetical protein
VTPRGPVKASPPAAQLLAWSASRRRCDVRVIPDHRAQVRCFRCFRRSCEDAGGSKCQGWRSNPGGRQQLGHQPQKRQIPASSGSASAVLALILDLSSGGLFVQMPRRNATDQLPSHEDAAGLRSRSCANRCRRTAARPRAGSACESPARPRVLQAAPGLGITERASRPSSSSASRVALPRAMAGVAARARGVEVAAADAARPARSRARRRLEGPARQSSEGGPEGSAEVRPQKRRIRASCGSAARAHRARARFLTDRTVHPDAREDPARGSAPPARRETDAMLDRGRGDAHRHVPPTAGGSRAGSACGS